MHTYGIIIFSPMQSPLVTLYLFKMTELHIIRVYLKLCYGKLWECCQELTFYPHPKANSGWVMFYTLLPYLFQYIWPWLNLNILNVPSKFLSSQNSSTLFQKDNPNFELSIPEIPPGHNLLNLFYRNS